MGSVAGSWRVAGPAVDLPRKAAPFVRAGAAACAEVADAGVKVGCGAGFAVVPAEALFLAFFDMSF